MHLLISCLVMGTGKIRERIETESPFGMADTPGVDKTMSPNRVTVRPVGKAEETSSAIRHVIGATGKQYPGETR